MINFLTHFATTDGCVPPQFFGLHPWYYYLQTNKDCSIKSFNVLGSSGTSDFILVILAIIDDMLRIAGFIAIGFIIYGGIMYVTSQGSPDQTGKAQNTIINALIGLVLAIVAVALVSFLGNRLG
jgi:hypothetical protein